MAVGTARPVTESAMRPRTPPSAACCAWACAGSETDTYMRAASGKKAMQHGWFLGRLTSSEAKLAIESVAKLAAGAEVSSKKEVTSDLRMVTGERHFHSS